MLRLLPFVILLAVYVYAFIDLATARGEDVRVLPRAVWLLVMLVVPILGVAAWFGFGRPVSAGGGPGGPGGLSLRLPRPTNGPGGGSPGPVAPDDDPEFLRRLDEQRRRTGEGPDPK